MVDILNDADSADGEAAVDHGISRRGFLSGRRSLRSPKEALQPDTAPPPPPPKRKKRRPLVSTASGVLSFLGIAAIAIAVAMSVGIQRLQAPGPLAADKVVNLASSTDPDVPSLVDHLEREGVIENQPLMLAALWIERERKNVKHGEYLFKQGASLQDVIDTLVSGRQILHAITIPEGLTSQQVVDRLSADDILVGDVTTTPREGSLRPDTYKFARGFKREQLIHSMEAEQNKVVADVWSHRSPDLPIHSPYEMVTLASIVEKETGRADERPRVAAVFINRLMRNMPLQSDPTIVYGLVGGKGTLGRSITRADLTQRTPYNTYTITGLPPGPIANPGRAALEAVANPSRTKELYFVADGTGGHAFADNLDQHRQNVAHWRQIEKDAKDKLDPDADKAAPPAAPAPGLQRGDSGDPQVFGSLGAAFGKSGGQMRSGPAIAAFGVSALSGSALAASPATPTPAALLAARMQTLDVQVEGVETEPDPSVGSATPDSPVDDGHGATMATFPVPAARLAGERAQAKALGLQASAPNSMIAPDAAAATIPMPATANQRYGKGKIIDASEGTALDPLRDKTYDLNSAKTVPVLKALPPPAAMSYAN